MRKGELPGEAERARIVPGPQRLYDGLRRGRGAGLRATDRDRREPKGGGEKPGRKPRSCAGAGTTWGKSRSAPGHTNTAVENTSAIDTAEYNSISACLPYAGRPSQSPHLLVGKEVPYSPRPRISADSRTLCVVNSIGAAGNHAGNLRYFLSYAAK